MANAIDPQRRRLTVAPGMGGQVAPGATGDYSGRSVEFLSYLNDAHANGKKAICFSSRTDDKMATKKSFEEKDTDVLVADGAKREVCEKWLRDDLGIAFACKKGCKPESPNQDSYSIFAVEGDYVLMGVYDGHGPYGHDVSEFVRVELPKSLLECGEALFSNTERCFAECFVNCQKMIEAEKSMDSSRSGATTTMALWNLKTAAVTVAHVGDSRSVLGTAAADGKWKTEDITVDHKPNLPAEKKRIESSTPPGRVVFDGFYNYRVFAQGGMYPGLNMSRALGDVVAHKEAGLTAEPDVKSFSTEQKPEGGYLTFVMCTDGVWEFIESGDAFTRIKAGETDPAALQASIEKLTKDSYDAWMGDSDNEISDDITGICIRF